jgi:hypothetical protein
MTALQVYSTIDAGQVMLCEFVGGPLDGDSRDMDEGGGTVYYTDPDRGTSHVYRSDGNDPSRFIHAEEISLAEYRERTKLSGFGPQQSKLPDWIFGE